MKNYEETHDEFGNLRFIILQKIKDNSIKLESFFSLGKRRKKAFLDLMLDLDENEKVHMTDEEIRQQVETFMFAVSESNS